MNNNSAMVIAANPFTKTMLAGIEGGILRTEDHFDSWKHLELGTDAFDPENPINLRYPYISAIVFSERYEGFVLAGGLDRGREYMQSYLGFSMDDGRTWEDKSALIKDYGQRVNMERDPAGRILIGLMPRPDSLPGEAGEDVEFLFTIGELIFPDPVADALEDARHIAMGWWNSATLGLFNARHHPVVWMHDWKQWMVHPQEAAEGMEIL